MSLQDSTGDRDEEAGPRVARFRRGEPPQDVADLLGDLEEDANHVSDALVGAAIDAKSAKVDQRHRQAR